MQSRNNMPKLLQLIKANADKPKQFRVDNGAEDASIYLYDAIDSFWGINAQDFVKEIGALTAPTIHLRINSPGGDVFDARAIATAIANHPSNIIAHIDGLAASAATYIALSADSVEMADGGFFMIHNAWTLAFGNSEDMLAMADLLDKIDSTIIKDYAKKTGKPMDEIKAWMSAETWFTAQEALNNGFIDSIAESPKVENKWDLGAYVNAPKALTEPPAVDQREQLGRRLRLLETTPA